LILVPHPLFYVALNSPLFLVMLRILALCNCTTWNGRHAWHPGFTWCRAHSARRQMDAPLLKSASNSDRWRSAGKCSGSTCPFRGSCH